MNAVCTAAHGASIRAADDVEAVAPEQAPPPVDARHGDLDDARNGGVCAFVDELHR